MHPDLSTAVWRKSSRSGGEGGNCVELAGTEAAMAVRDSKNPAGPTLVFTREAFRAFAESVTDRRHG